MLSVIFFLAWRTQGRQAHALLWSFTFAIASVQWLCNLFSTSFPSYAAYWIVVNALALTAVTFAVKGHCIRVGRKIYQELLWGLPVVVLAAVAWFTIAQPHAGLRMALGPAYSAFALAFCACCILRFGKRRQPAEWGAALTIIIFAVTQLAAAGAAILQGPIENQAHLDVYLAVNFLAMPAAFIGMGMFVIFMLASDISIELKEQAVRDGLTGLLNRRGFGEAAASAYSTARRTDRPVSVIMTDIDRFKSINDEFGHATGDLALAHFAKILAEERRAEDILSRMGGRRPTWEGGQLLPGLHAGVQPRGQAGGGTLRRGSSRGSSSAKSRKDVRLSGRFS